MSDLKKFFYVLVIITIPFFPGCEFLQELLGIQPESFELIISQIGSGEVINTPEADFYDDGTIVALAALPASGWTFSNWEGAAAGSSNPATITMDAAKSVTAVFSQDSYQLSIVVAGNGAVTRSPVQASYFSGTEVTLTAEPSHSWTFSNWTGDVVGSTNPLTVTMDSAKQITAIFSENSYELSVSISGDGTVVRSPNQPSYLSGTVVDLTAEPADGWSFSSWVGDVVSSANPLTMTMDSIKQITAIFSQDLYELSVSTSGNGAVSRSPDQAAYLSGTTIVLSAEPAAGWSFTNWSGDVISSENPLTITMDSARQVTASFNQDLYELAVSTAGNGTVERFPDQAAYPSGAVVELTAEPSAGWSFNTWSGDAVGTTNPISITVDSAKQVTAEFSQDSYSLSLSVTGNGTIARSPDQTSFLSGTDVELTAEPASGWNFGSWSGDAAGSINPLLITMDTSKSVSATFTLGDITAPGEVTNLAASAADGGVSLSWADPLDSDFSHCEIWYGANGTADTTFSGAVSSLGTEVTGLINGNAYVFLLKTVDTTGNISEGAIIAAMPTSSTTVLHGESTFSYLDIIQLAIFGVSVQDSYSVDNQTTWQKCDSGYQQVTLTPESRVWIRDDTESGSERYLGQAESFTGPDLIAGDFLFLGQDGWYDQVHAAPGEVLELFCYITNIGDSSAYSSDHTIRFYISEDREITDTDTQIHEVSFPYSCPVGDTFVCESAPTASFAVPGNLVPGTYFIGCIVDATAVITEINEGNNATSPETVVEITVTDTAVLSSGAVKIVNSWGTGTWENKSDGHYWMPYDVLKNNQVIIRYYYNSFSNQYEPSVLMAFKVDHPYREEIRITMGLGDPNQPYMEKFFQSREWYGTPISGALPFPPNLMCLDISEFATAINRYDLFMTIENTGSTTAAVTEAAVEFYSEYDSPPFKTIDGSNVTVAGGETSSILLSTKGSLNFSEEQAILPLPRALAVDDIALSERLPTSEEIASYKNRYGVFSRGTNYNDLYYGQYGTGNAPPSSDEWDAMKILVGIDTYTYMGPLPDAIDHSLTQYFPPVGNQGSEGSCSAFSVGYYIHTFTEAKEHDWDLSGTTWTASPWPGYPSTNLDRIISPDFVYHQINYGGDYGSNISQAASLLTRIGGATWSTMPYDDTESTSWPSEAAWREAARYRGREVPNLYWDYVPVGYFIIEDDSDIHLLKSILAAGYCVSTAVDADIYSIYLDSNDVLSAGTMWATTNHAQTIVGYKEGSTWDVSNPDQ